MTMTIDEKNQRVLALSHEIFEDRMNNSDCLSASFTNMLNNMWNDDFRCRAAHLLATFFHRCQIVEGASKAGGVHDPQSMWADEAQTLHQLLKTDLTRYLKPLVVKHAVEMVDKANAGSKR